MAKKNIGAKVSEKGAVSIYGLGRRFPVTLYRAELEALLDNAAKLREFIKRNEAQLATKVEGGIPSGVETL